jgi:hypothetical protein
MKTLLEIDDGLVSVTEILKPAAPEVVNYVHVVALSDEMANQVGANHPGASSDQYSH